MIVIECLKFYIFFGERYCEGKCVYSKGKYKLVMNLLYEFI